VRTFLQATAKFRVERLSSWLAKEGVMVARMQVQLLPLREARSRRVSLELRKGMCMGAAAAAAAAAVLLLLLLPPSPQPSPAACPLPPPPLSPLSPLSPGVLGMRPLLLLPMLLLLGARLRALPGTLRTLLSAAAAPEAEEAALEGVAAAEAAAASLPPSLDSTSARVERDLLMKAPSLKRSPTVAADSWRSEPARSTR
jgi:hypothetical protein